MFKRRLRLPSPALVISMLALSIALGGTALAGTSANPDLDAKAVKALILKLAPSLNVNSAKTAGSAATAANATNAKNATSATNATNAKNATNATSAVSATNATNATNSAQLGGHAASYYAHAGHEAVQFVGTTGEPTFRNGWKNYGGVWSHAGFWKDAFGVVHLQGTLTGRHAGKVAFQLPAGYRPPAALFTVAANGNHSSSIEILANGEIIIIGSGSLGLDGITFLPGAATATARQRPTAHDPAASANGT
jgi:hypothetical protein